MCGSLFTKIPQIVKIYKAQSTAGITELYFYVDLLNMINRIAWAKHEMHPFNTYGDTVLLLV